MLRRGKVKQTHLWGSAYVTWSPIATSWGLYIPRLNTKAQYPKAMMSSNGKAMSRSHDIHEHWGIVELMIDIIYAMNYRLGISMEIIQWVSRCYARGEKESKWCWMRGHIGTVPTKYRGTLSSSNISVPQATLRYKRAAPQWYRDDSPRFLWTRWKKSLKMGSQLFRSCTVCGAQHLKIDHWSPNTKFVSLDVRGGFIFRGEGSSAETIYFGYRQYCQSHNPAIWSFVLYCGNGVKQYRY